MYGKESVELFLLGLEDGMSTAQAAELAGVRPPTARGWASGRLPHGYTGRRRTMGGRRTPRGRTPGCPQKGPEVYRYFGHPIGR